MGSKGGLLALFLFLLLHTVNAQTAPGKYWIGFTDKLQTPYSLSNPSAFLSQRALDRRTRQGINLKVNDLPVDPAYVDSILQTGAIKLLHRSKWFNGITVYTTDTAAIDSIKTFSFVSQVKSVKQLSRPAPEMESKEVPELRGGVPDTYYHSIYGASYNQIQMLNGHLLHQDGFRGEGMRIAVLDAGFNMVDQLDAFQTLREDGRLLGGWNFVGNHDTIFKYSNHGTFVLSTMAGDLTGELLGTAPAAEYYLLVTEDVAGEFIVEEDNWVAGAEFADSAGADVLNTSLGYTTFQDSTTDHFYFDMDGNITRITQGADIAASKGMLVVNSAGNSGTQPWFYIGAPADADSVLAVGAVDTAGQSAAFSSHGPSSDGRVKPNVVAQGAAAVVLDFAGGVRTVNGTSFSSPITAGMAACLWQAHPELSNMEIFHAIERSAHLYANPNPDFGYGIPDYYQAHLDLSPLLTTPAITVYPNPVTTYSNLLFDNPHAQTVTIRFYDEAGRHLLTWETEELPAGRCHIRLGERIAGLREGLITLEVQTGETTLGAKLIKVNP